MVESAEVAIVGGGIVGSYAAYCLAKSGVRVMLLEKGRIGGEQSSRNWGFVRLQGRDPVEIPLMIEGRRLWADLGREIGADVEWRQGGNLVLTDDAARFSRFEAWLDTAKQFQVDSRLVTPAEAARIVPGLEAPCVGGLYTPSDGQAEPERAAAAIAAAAQAAGATVRTGVVVDRIEVEGGKVRGVETENGPIRADVVILSAGAWTKHLLRGVGVRMPQLWMRGSVARTTPARRRVTEAGVWAGVAFRQRPDASFNIAGGTQADHDLMLDTLLDGLAFRPLLAAHRDLVKVRLGRAFFDLLPARLSQRGLSAALRRHRALDPAPNTRALRITLEKLLSGVSGLGELAIERSWAGYIDCTPDFIPVIDRLERPAGLVIAAGLSGHGFGMGPITGRLAAELAAGRPSSHDLRAFRLSRFSDGTRIEPRNVV